MLINKNDKIAIICPASPAEKNDFELIISKFKDFNFETSPLAFDIRDDIDTLHAKEIERVFADTSISAIICGRGGYGTTRRLQMLDYGLIKNNPKPFFGFSDTTALQMALYKNSNLKSYTGMIGKVSSDNLLLLSSFNKIIKKETQKFSNINIIGANSVSGELIGGNLAMITSLIGTPYIPDFKNKILVIEEIGESPYRIDRMLYQLYHSGALDDIKALCIGTFVNCINPKFPDGKSALSYIEDFSRQLNCPIIYGLPYGHQDERIIFGYDSFCEINNNEMIIY